jgi:hypothetical protein
MSDLPDDDAPPSRPPDATERASLTGTGRHPEEHAAGAPADSTLSEATLRAYGMDWKHFATWCGAHDQPSLPASRETVLEYLSGLLRDGRRPRGATRVATSVNAAHRARDSATNSEIRSS